MHYSSLAAALFFLPTLISAKSGSLYARYAIAEAEADAYTGLYEGALYSRNAYASPHTNYGNEPIFHVKRAIEARYAEADALAEAYAEAEAEAEAFPFADTEISLEDLYRRAAYAYPEAFPEPAKPTPAQCKAKADRETAGYKDAEKTFQSESSKFDNNKKSKKLATAIAAAAGKVATGRRRATKALKDGGCATDSGHDAETSKWEQKQQQWQTVARNCPAGS
ncbi:hypothetical protein MMC17_006302 [Xylographa soralifera]|nr:hypothetical protein [Xylographa soralifera]